MLVSLVSDFRLSVRWWVGFGSIRGGQNVSEEFERDWGVGDSCEVRFSAKRRFGFPASFLPSFHTVCRSIAPTLFVFLFFFFAPFSRSFGLASASGFDLFSSS